jgi:hypothetical protein
VCCTFFASFGALFLFLISGLMRSNYRYMHVEGDIEAMKDPVSYAGAWGFSCAPPRRPPCQPALTRALPPPLFRSVFLPHHRAYLNVLLGKGEREEARVGGERNGNRGAHERGGRL